MSQHGGGGWEREPVLLYAGLARPTVTNTWWLPVDILKEMSTSLLWWEWMPSHTGERQVTWKAQSGLFGLVILKTVLIIWLSQISECFQVFVKVFSHREINVIFCWKQEAVEADLHCCPLFNSTQPLKPPVLWAAARVYTAKSVGLFKQHLSYHY